MGRAGALSRLLGPNWGSWATFASVRAGGQTAPGQFTAQEMLGIYDVLNIGAATRRFALIGNAVFGSPSPAMHRAGYEEAGLDARYFPIELDELEQCLPLLGHEGLAGVEALAVTIPFKEAAGALARPGDKVAAATSAVNTVLVRPDGWKGYNTDGPAILQLVREHLDLRGARAAVVGAGGTARAAAAVLHAAGAKVSLFNRTPSRATTAARRLGVEGHALEELSDARWDILVQATPQGTQGERILAAEGLPGRVVVDGVYGETTPLVRDAREHGLVAIDGFDLLVAQAVLQFELMTGTRPEARVLRQAGQRWLAGRAAPGPPTSS
jgi:shikimate dehydrogenase